MKKRAAILAAVLSVHVSSAQAEDLDFSGAAAFMFNGAPIVIAPASTDAARHAALFAAIAPACNPHCIASQTVAEGVATLQEPDVLAFLVSEVSENMGLLADAPMPGDRAQGFIPGSVSLPFETVSENNEFRDEILKALGARAFEDVFNFTDAQDLVVFDGGPTQDDAAMLINHLLGAGYPPEKIRYYRGGMQVWSVLGLTVQE
jgi:hypothetical protein